MRNLILFSVVTICVTQLGCSSILKGPEPTASERRKTDLIKCVGNFLGQDVGPGDSLNICTKVYSRWESSTMTGSSNGKQ